MGKEIKGKVAPKRIAAVEDGDEDEAEASTAEITPSAAPLEGIGIESAGEVSTRLNTEHDDADIVTVAIGKECDPAPVVGHFKFSDYNMTKLSPGDRVKIPYYVAIHLVDKKYGTIIEG